MLARDSNVPICHISRMQDAGLGVGPDVLIHMSSIVFPFLLYF